MHPSRLRFDRHELAGAFGDVGTDLPLLVGLVAIGGVDPASACIAFGLCQIASGLLYGIPMPVQPLKAMAAILLTEQLAPGVFAGGGLVIGAAMLLLAATGALGWVARAIPLEVVRGMQLGLGITLATLGLREYAGAAGAGGYALAAFAFVLLLALRRQQVVPAPLVVIGGGALWAVASGVELGALGDAVGLHLPTLVVPTGQELLQGALLLALPQLPLSLGNSVVATSQVTRDLFPHRPAGVRRIGFTYGAMNLVAPLFGGIPVCHGCGGVVGFHGFGARTGGAPVIYGSLYLATGLFLAPAFGTVAQLLPLPILGVVLLFEALLLMALVRDVALDPASLWIALAVAAAVVALPYGYLVGLLAGTLLVAGRRKGWTAPSAGPGLGASP